MQKENWKQIDGANGYMVSNRGNIKSIDKEVPYKTRNGKTGLRTVVGQTLKPYIRVLEGNRSNYSLISISVEGKKRNLLIHRLVAKAFILNPDNKPQVNHIDGDGTNNELSNLEWATQTENMQHAYRVLGIKPWQTGLPTGKQPRSKQIAQYTLDMKLVKVWRSMKEACRELGACSSSLSLAARGLQEEHIGFKWKYCVAKDLNKK